MAGATLLLTELVADNATELDARLDDNAAREEAGAIEEVAVDEGATLLAGAVDDAGLGGVDPPPPPPPPQAVNNPLRVRVRSNLGLFINRSYLLSDLIGDTNGFTTKT